MDELLEQLLESAAQAGMTTATIEELIAVLTNLADTAGMARETFKELWGTIETGARLEGLSSATGESVAKLYEFERGLDAVGRKARYLPTIFADMQRALSVTNDSDRVASAFAMLSLDPGQLRREDTADVVLDVARAMGNVDPNEAAWAGDQIFGKFQTQSILAMSRSMDLFRDEMAESSQTGEELEKYSKTFEAIVAARGDINNDALGLRTALAGNLAPEIIEELTGGAQSGIDLENIDELRTNRRTPGLNHFKPEFTPLEKMGFIMSGSKVQNPYDQHKIDLLQQIANNTRSLSQSLPVPMPNNTSLRDVIDPSPFISNIV